MRRKVTTLLTLALLTACSSPSAPRRTTSTPQTAATRPPVPTTVVPASVAPTTVTPVISNNGASLTGKVKAPASLIGDAGGTIISDNGGGIISDHGAGVVSNNGGSFRLLQAAAEHPFAGATVTLLDAQGQPAGPAFTTKTAADGSYRFTDPLPARNMLVVVTLPENRGRLVAAAPRQARQVDVDLASSLATGFILETYVKTQPDPLATFEKLTAEADATTRQRTAEALAALNAAPPAHLTQAEAAASVEDLRARNAPLRDQLEVVRKLLIAAGQSNLGDGRPGTEVAIPWIRRILAGPDGGLYLVSGTDRRVWRLDPNGRIAAVAGRAPTNPDAQIDGRPAVDVALESPQDMAFDGQGRLVILEVQDDLDEPRYRLSRIEPDGKLKTLVPFTTGDAIALFPDMRVLLRDGKLLQVDPDGKVSTTTSVQRPPQGLSSDMYGLDAQDRLYTLTMLEEAATSEVGTALGDPDGDQLYGVVRAGERLATVRSGVREGMALDPGGNVFFLDAAKHLVVLKPDGTQQTLVSAMDQRLGIGAALLQPDGTAYVVSNRGVVLRVKDGAVTPVAGTSGTAGGDATATSLQPKALAVAPNGDVYASDRVGHRVVKIAPSGALSTVAGTGAPDNDGLPTTDDGVAVEGKPATEVRLYEPNVLRVGANGELYVASDRGDVFARVDAAGAYHFIWPANGFRVKDFVPVADGKLLVAREVYKNGYSRYQGEDLVLLDPLTKAETVISSWTDEEDRADDFIGALAALADGGVLLVGPNQVRKWHGGTALDPVVKLATPFDFDLGPSAAADAQGRLYLTSATNLHRLDLASGVLKAVAGPGTGVLGGTTVDDGLARPTSPSVAPDGSVWVVDYDHKQVKRIPADRLP